MHGDTGDDTGVGPDSDDHRMPLWVKVFVVIAILLVVLVVIILVTGLHTPVQHGP